MVIDDRGSRLEVYPTKRAKPEISTLGQSVYQVLAREASAPIGPKELGVVFNHVMQVEGYINGEVAFKFKGNSPPPNGFETLYPSFAKLTNPNVYFVIAKSPGEFVQLVRGLQQRTDLEWVEPIVQYGQAVNEPTTPQIKIQ